MGKSLSEIAGDLYIEQPTTILFHYTSVRGFMGIIPSCTLHATEVHYLNDATEMKRTGFLLRDAAAGSEPRDEFTARLRGRFLDWLDQNLTELGRAIFVGCFTAQGNLLSQWRSYGEPGKGVSIGFAPNKLAESAGVQSWLVGKCIYDRRRQEELAVSILDAVEMLARQEFVSPERLTFNAVQHFFADIEADLLRIAALLKHPAFSEEQEWRVVSPFAANTDTLPIGFREGHSMLTPYREFHLPAANDRIALEQVWIGPTPHAVSATVTITEYLRRHRANPRLGVGDCGIPYRAW
jgi:hypothetical protein